MGMFNIRQMINNNGLQQGNQNGLQHGNQNGLQHGNQNGLQADQTKNQTGTQANQTGLQTGAGSQQTNQTQTSQTQINNQTQTNQTGLQSSQAQINNQTQANQTQANQTQANQNQAQYQSYYQVDQEPEETSTLKEIGLDHYGVIRYINNLSYIVNTMGMMAHIESNEKLIGGRYIFDKDRFIFNDKDIECLYASKTKEYIILYCQNIALIKEGDTVVHESDIDDLLYGNEIVAVYDENGEPLSFDITKPIKEQSNNRQSNNRQ